jgi:hypothetical protein
MRNITLEQLAQKIQEGLSQGYKLEDIKKLAEKQGFDKSSIQEAVSLLNQSNTPQKKTYPLWSKITFWVLWLLVLGLFLAGIFFGFWDLVL